MSNNYQGETQFSKSQGNPVNSVFVIRQSMLQEVFEKNKGEWTLKANIRRTIEFVIGKTHVHLCPEIRRVFKKEPLLIALGLKKRGHNYIKPSSFRRERNQRKWPNTRPDRNQRKWPSRQTEVNGNGRADKLKSREWSGRKWKLDGGSKCQQWLAGRKLWNSARLEHRINSNGTSP